MRLCLHLDCHHRSVPQQQSSAHVYDQQEFHSLFQGDMSAGKYCGCLKRFANTLYDCDAAVSDPALVINTLRGLNNKFSQTITVL